MGEKRVQVVSAAIVRERRRILLAQRSPNTSFPMAWCTPGGKVEPDENPITALGRELIEELDLGLGYWYVPGAKLHVELDPPVVNRPMTVVTYWVDFSYVSQKPVPRGEIGGELVGVGWFTARDLAHVELTPADNANRERLIALLDAT